MNCTFVAIVWDLPFYLALALGMYISLRVCRFPDLTVDGSFAFGMAGLYCGLQVGSSLVGLFLALALGALAGCATALLYSVRPQPLYKLLSGLLVMSAISSVTYRMLNGDAQGLRRFAHFFNLLFYYELEWRLTPWRPLSLLLAILSMTTVAFLLYRFLGSDRGRVLRCVGARPRGAEVLGVSHRKVTIAGLALANAIIALGGWLKGLMNNQVDVWEPGVILHALGALLLGEILIDALRVGDRTVRPKFALLGCFLGAIVYSAAVAFATFLVREAMGRNYEAKDQEFVVTGLLFLVIISTRLGRGGADALEDASLF